jgi:hypothetical protein
MTSINNGAWIISFAVAVGSQFSVAIPFSWSALSASRVWESPLPKLGGSALHDNARQW